MIEKFIEVFVKALVDKPECLKITKEQIGENTFELTIYSDKADVGKIIGKNGNMVEAIKVILSGHRAKQDAFFRVNVCAINDD